MYIKTVVCDCEIAQPTVGKGGQGNLGNGGNTKGMFISAVSALSVLVTEKGDAYC